MHEQEREREKERSDKDFFPMKNENLWVICATYMPHIWYIYGRRTSVFVSLLQMDTKRKSDVVIWVVFFPLKTKIETDSVNHFQ